MTGSRLLAGASAILVLVALVCIVGYATLPAGRHYQLFGDITSLYHALSKMEPGSTVGELEQQLGPAQIVGESLRLKMIEGHKMNAIQHSAVYPDGVTEHDQFILYRAGDSGITLQIRDGKLINLDPAILSNGPEPVQMWP